MGKKKTLIVGEQEYNYLDKLITSELEKFDDVASKSSNPQIKEEKQILNNLKKIL